MPRHEGKGLRPNQRTTKVDCTAFVKCSAKKDIQKLVIVDVCLKHSNHEVSEAVFRHYPQNRRLTAEEALLAAEPVNELQSNPSLLRSFLQNKTGKPLTAKDIENVVARLKGSKKPDVDQLAEEIKEIFRKDPTAAVTLGTSESNEMELLFIQTTMMAQFYEKFPEVLLLDGTYRTNNLKMALFVFMVVDGNGCSQVVAYCFVSSEDLAHMDTMMRTFVGLQGMQKTKCVIVDKDFKEIRAIRDNFSPDTVIQLCEFHVKKALKRAVGSSKTDNDKKMLNSLLERMIHAPNEEAYQDLKAELDRTASKSFTEYFNKNWDGIQDMWVRYRCDRHFNLGNNTTNRVECHNSKLKAVLKANDKLHATLKSMLKLHSIKIIEAEHRHALDATTTFFTYKSSSDLIQQCSSLLTPFATQAVVCEEERANKMAGASIANDGEDYSVTTERGVYEVLYTLASCTCRTFTTMGVICRHIILVSWQTGRAIDVATATNSRWKKASQPYLPAEISNRGAPQLQCMQLKEPDYSTASRGAKYNHALCLLKDIGDLVAECGSEEFKCRINLIKKLKALWMENKTVEIWCSSGTESDEDAFPEDCSDTIARISEESTPSSRVRISLSCLPDYQSPGAEPQSHAEPVTHTPEIVSRQSPQFPGTAPRPPAMPAAQPLTPVSSQGYQFPGTTLRPSPVPAAKSPAAVSSQGSQVLSLLPMHLNVFYLCSFIQFPGTALRPSPVSGAKSSAAVSSQGSQFPGTALRPSPVSGAKSPAAVSSQGSQFPGTALKPPPVSGAKSSAAVSSQGSQFPGTALRPSPVSGAKSPAAVSSQGSQFPGTALRPSPVSGAKSPAAVSSQSSQFPGTALRPSPVSGAKSSAAVSSQGSQFPGTALQPSPVHVAKSSAAVSSQVSQFPGTALKPPPVPAAKSLAAVSSRDSQFPGTALRPSPVSGAKSPAAVSSQSSQFPGTALRPSPVHVAKSPAAVFSRDSQLPGTALKPPPVPAAKSPAAVSSRDSQFPGTALKPPPVPAAKSLAAVSSQSSQFPGTALRPSPVSGAKSSAAVSSQGSQFPGTALQPSPVHVAKSSAAVSSQVSQFPGTALKPPPPVPAAKSLAAVSSQGSQFPGTALRPSPVHVAKSPAAVFSRDSQLPGTALKPPPVPAAKSPAAVSSRDSQFPGTALKPPPVPAAKSPAAVSSQGSQFPGTALRPSPVSGAKSPAAVSSQGSQLPGTALKPPPVPAAKSPAAVSSRDSQFPGTALKPPPVPAVKSPAAVSSRDSQLPGTALKPPPVPAAKSPAAVSSRDSQYPGTALKPLLVPAAKSLAAVSSQDSQLPGTALKPPPVPGATSPAAVSSQGSQVLSPLTSNVFDLCSFIQFPGTALLPPPVPAAKSSAAEGSQLPNAAGLEEGVLRKSLSMKLSQGFQLPDAAGPEEGLLKKSFSMELSQGFELSNAAGPEGLPMKSLPMELSQGFELPESAGPDEELSKEIMPVQLSQGLESSDTAVSAAVNSALQGVRLSARKRPRGNPCGSKDSCTGTRFPSRKKANQASLNCLFAALPTKEKTLRMLHWFVDGETASDTLKDGYCIQERDISVTSKSLSSGALDTRAPILTLKKYFSRAAWCKINELLKEKKEQGLWFCHKCDLEDDHTIKMIACDLCMEWYHWPCVGIGKKTVPRGDWFCYNCK
ncbi:NAC-alpha domain-containing protein 1-like isoform X11 [Ixodes scapularis]|uniref:NAC-alpha domain-containing protein 1-like isoform X11 n=1 Tax=Ixodes scapularis TaxID=6945 RepID=UPI001C38E3B1|nr:NAC-alpha domain-containing protein 1-like isoform X11 [Ixodes scapularis]